jgi:hypothetical protein
MFTQAAILGNEAVISVLLQASASINARDNTGQTALHYSQEDTTKFLVDAEEDLEIKDNKGCTALHPLQRSGPSKVRLL